MSAYVTVLAICTGCKQESEKDLHPDDASGSFKHVCVTCQGVQWHNVIEPAPGVEA